MFGINKDKKDESTETVPNVTGTQASVEPTDEQEKKEDAGSTVSDSAGPSVSEAEPAKEDVPADAAPQPESGDTSLDTAGLPSEAAVSGPTTVDADGETLIGPGGDVDGHGKAEETDPR